MDAGKVELEQGSSYAGLEIPFDLRTLVILEVLLVGFVEVQRNNGALIPDTRGPRPPLNPPPRPFALVRAAAPHARPSLVMCTATFPLSPLRLFAARG